MILNKNNATKDEEAESVVSPFVERREKFARKNSVREANAMGPKQFRTTPTTEKERAKKQVEDGPRLFGLALRSGFFGFGRAIQSQFEPIRD